MKIKAERLFQICKAMAISFDRFLSITTMKEESTGFERLTKDIADKKVGKE